jgi:hypothetical protein
MMSTKISFVFKLAKKSKFSFFKASNLFLKKKKLKSLLARNYNKIEKIFLSSFQKTKKR